MTDELRQAVLNALEKSRRALDEAERLLDHQPPPRGEIPLASESSPVVLVLMVLGVLVFVALVIALNVWWVRHTWN